MVPYLTEGLIEVAKRTPEDPVDYLVKFYLITIYKINDILINNRQIFS